MEFSEENHVERLNGYIIKFDMGRNTGTINGKGGVQFSFSSEAFAEKIVDLMKIPGVSFEIENGQVVHIRNDGSLPKIRDKPSSGLALFGAAKCPECKWRLPILPNKEVPKFRSVSHGRCPECSTSIKLISAFKGYHHFAAVGIIVLPAIARFFLNRLYGFMDESLFQSLAFISLLFYPVQLFLFFYLYFQEKLVRVEEVAVFE